MTHVLRSMLDTVFDDTKSAAVSLDEALRQDAGSAEQHANAALRIAPNNSPNHIAIGWAFWVRNDFDKAQKAALSALALSPNSQDAHALLAAIEMHRKPLTGWFHRVGYIADNKNFKTATLYLLPAQFLYMSASDIPDYFGHGGISDGKLRFVMVGAVLLLVSNQMYFRKAAKHHKAATLRKDY